ncbi:hypothetical protein F511_43764 [Dorcoceras hygrometricum]|uniref:Uncharacterized protein n=1 Tax=Dorcoceras hygrometricum TaxID=472368 RepID=A0A2Z7BB46_9LAMI|nr:hypothetical protein F511_43764 [Dorcoceras hygrometricum]
MPEPFRLDHPQVQMVLTDQPWSKPWANQDGRRDHLLVFTFVLPSPATNAGALPAGPPPGPDGSNRPTMVQTMG